jgi:hypothetical protein
VTPSLCNLPWINSFYEKSEWSNTQDVHTLLFSKLLCFFDFFQDGGSTSLIEQVAALFVFCVVRFKICTLVTAIVMITWLLQKNIFLTVYKCIQSILDLWTIFYKCSRPTWWEAKKIRFRYRFYNIRGDSEIIFCVVQVETNF